MKNNDIDDNSIDDNVIDNTATKDNNDLSNFIIDDKISDDSQSYIDKITLECLMNKNHYNRYISKANPEKFNVIREHYNNMSKYRDQIIDLTIELIQNPEKQINTEVNESFDQYTKTLIRYFEMNEFENKINNDYENDDDDMLFSNMQSSEPVLNSFWGKDRIVKRSNSSMVYKKKNY